MDDNKHKDQFSASLPLPDDGDKKQSNRNPAADLIRKKVEAAYSHEPDADEEIAEVEDLSPKVPKSKHQEFIYSLTNSGRPLHEIQTAWHEYYAGLTDAEKHQVWQEFYNTQSRQAHHPVMTHREPSPVPAKTALSRPSHKAKAAAAHTAKKLTEAKGRVKRPAARRQPVQHQANPMHSMLFGLGVGSIVILIFMFTFFNERIIAPFIQPSRNATNIPLITTGTVSSAPEVIIPKINVQVPVVYDVATISDAAIQKGLERGVVHYADTAVPGEDGNVVIVGHSSGNIFNAGKYKFAFSLLRALDTGDTFYLQKDSKRYTYQIYKKEVVKPTDVSVLGLTDKPASATLITCDPPGLSTNRLVVIGQQISPSPSANKPADTSNKLATSTALIPSDSPTLWSRLTHWFKQ